MTPVSRRGRSDGIGAGMLELRTRLQELLFESAELRGRIRHSRSQLQQTWERIQAGHLQSHAVPAAVPQPTAPDQSDPPASDWSDLAGGAERLTAREREVLRLIVEGNSTKEIGHLLGISFKTASSHRWRVMQKMGVHETASLVRLAIERRLIAS